MFRNLLVASVLTGTATLLAAQTAGFPDPDSDRGASAPAPELKAWPRASDLDAGQREGKGNRPSGTREPVIPVTGVGASRDAPMPMPGTANRSAGNGRAAGGSANAATAADAPPAPTPWTAPPAASPSPTSPPNAWSSPGAMTGANAPANALPGTAAGTPGGSPATGWGGIDPAGTAAAPLHDDARPRTTPLQARPWESTRPNSPILNGVPTPGPQDNGQRWNTQQRGDRTYSTDSNGNTWTSQTRGNQTIINGSDGLTRVCSTYGNQTYCQ